MNFEVAPEQLETQHALRRLFEEGEARRQARTVLDGKAEYDRALWQRLASLGYLGAAMPEALGGAGAGRATLCILAEEAGRSLAAIPLLSSIYLGAELLHRAADAATQKHLLPEIMAGRCLLAVAEAAALPVTHGMPRWRAGALDGEVAPVLDGGSADLLIVEAKDEDVGGTSLILLQSGAPGFAAMPLETIDPSRPQARLHFAATPGTVLGTPGQARRVLDPVADQAAVLVAFEQIGGAEQALAMARLYALERSAFGRQIGSFQAIKHKLVDMYVAITLARANALYAAWALEADSDELPHAAAIARVSATDAFQLCARENIQVHGGFGFTWEADCHLFYRRSHLLALTPRGGRYWRDRAIATLPLMPEAA